MQLAKIDATIRNLVLSVIALAAVSLLAHSFSSGGAPAASTAPARHYYLTKANFNGNQALKACASGYHFASFAELLDTGVLTYNSSLGRSNPDDGQGPPSIAWGWARTGYISSSTNTEFPTNNCNLWTSEATADAGTAGAFVPPYNQGLINETVSGFEPSTVFGEFACDNSQGDNIGVWCVQN
ncbi:MAG: hypothetical protein WBS24_15620 [Terriglobales bacterium]